jgi:hypothetical protein
LPANIKSQRGVSISLVVLTIPAAPRPRASLYYDLALNNNNGGFSDHAEGFLKVLVNENTSVSYINVV